jgi:cell division protease FtsH
MNSTVKTILVWVLILVTAVVLYTMVERGTAKPRAQLNFTEFLQRVDSGEVHDVTIRGSLLTGHLKSNPGEEFRTVIPQEYSRVYDKLTDKLVSVRITPPDSNSWLENSIPTWLIIGGSILWFAISFVVLVLVVDLSRFVKRELARTRTNPSTP